MAVRKLRPVTPSQRHMLVNDYAELTGSQPEKSLLVAKKKSGGRNQSGKMTMRYIGGGHKQNYRLIDFKRNKFDVPGTVKSVEYDPNRTAFIALVAYADGEKRYILAPKGIKVGQKVVSGKTATPDIGNAMYLSDIPFGTLVHNIELRPGQGGAMARSAGSYGQLTARDGKYAVIKLPSGETRMVLNTCIATVGTVSNSDH